MTEKRWDHLRASTRVKLSASQREMSSERSSDEKMAMSKDAQKDWLMEKSWDHRRASTRVKLSASQREMSLER
jgi:hypothetical protein